MTNRRGMPRPGRRNLQALVSGAAPAFTPASVASVTKFFWHDAQDNATITIVTGASQVTDKFGNGWTIAQATPAKQPTPDSSVFGGRQSLRFTAASSQEIAIVNAGLVTGMFGGTNVPYCIYKVVHLLSVTGSHYMHFTGSSTSATPIAAQLTGGAVWQDQRRVDAGTLTTRNQTGGIPAIATPFVVRMAYDGLNAHWNVNGTELTTVATSAVGAITFDKMIYGAAGGGAGASTSFLDGYIGESIGYSGIPTEEAQILTYLHTKWGF